MGKLPILGVCLGHQSIGAAFGGKIVRAQELMHGKTSLIQTKQVGVFRNLPEPFNGLGVIANYSYQDGSRDLTFSTPGFLSGEDEAQEFPLNFVGLSEKSYNFTLFYEKRKYSARIRYTYRDSFLVSESIDISNGQPLYTHDRGQLNASMSYNLNDTFAITLNGVNLLRERKVQPGVFANGPIARMSDSDRRISVGIRARF